LISFSTSLDLKHIELLTAAFYLAY